MMRWRRQADNTELTALLRLSRDGTKLYEGEIRPGHVVELANGLLLEVLWIRQHVPPEELARK
jgi:energy-converting hydrogenase Eha subunit G